jgi:hypothetical protein
MANVNPMQVKKLLLGLDFPTRRDRIISHAKSEGADNTILGLLNKLPNENYRTPSDISYAISDL